MLKESELHGIFIPIVTPFGKSGEVDLESFRGLSAALIAQGIHGLVVNGTTGESPTITEEEVAQLMKTARDAVAQHAQGGEMPEAADGVAYGNSAGGSWREERPARRVPIILGTGTNDTASTVRRTERAGELGADAALVVVPYYNKPSRQGIIEHFRRVAEVGLPVIAYDVPHRTGVHLAVDTMRTILDIDGVIGLKDSTEGIDRVSELTRFDTKPILCGHDTNFYAALVCGARGGMLASAHAETASFVALYDSFTIGSLQQSKPVFDRLLPLIRLLFAEPNPAPVKWLLAQQGLIASDALRLPMTPIGEELAKKIATLVLLK